MSILGYARVSTGDQDLAGQKRRLQAAGAYRVFEDVISGKTFERTGLADLFDHLRPGDTLAVVRLDRPGRSLRELLDVVENLQKREVALLSLEEKLDTSSAAGELVFHVFGALAQFQRRLIAERTRDGMNAARAKGSRPGRPPLNPEKLEAALLLVKGGMSPTKAARRTALGRSMLYREIQARDSAPPRNIPIGPTPEKTRQGKGQRNKHYRRSIRALKSRGREKAADIERMKRSDRSRLVPVSQSVPLMTTVGQH